MLHTIALHILTVDNKYTKLKLNKQTYKEGAIFRHHGKPIETFINIPVYFENLEMACMFILIILYLVLFMSIVYLHYALMNNDNLASSCHISKMQYPSSCGQSITFILRDGSEYHGISSPSHLL